MINIAIVDDEAEVLKAIKNCIMTVIDLPVQLNVSTFLEAEEVLEKLEKGVRFDVIFSDIQLKNMKGIEFGEKVRKNHPNIYFVFITLFPEYAAKSYSINAYQYILKNELEERLPGVLQQIVKNINKDRRDYKVFKVNSDARKILYKDIVYIKKMKSAKYVQFYTMDSMFRERSSLEKIMQELQDDNFIMIERGYIVNMNYIVRLNGNTIYLKNKDEVVISRQRLMDVKSRISEQWGLNNEYGS